MLKWTMNSAGDLEAVGVRYQYRIDYDSNLLSFSKLGISQPFLDTNVHRFVFCSSQNAAKNKAELIDSAITTHFDNE